ncbi:MAG: 5-formyltetrahydrofolate cyclo-ligase [Clostridiales bacterium]|nr:5-formyltetrahydrofolate cyclo-ligase [Clostridiales bacterium]
MTKKEIRSMIREKKKQLTPDEIREYSEKVCSILINEPVYKNARVIYPYLAYNQEIITDTLIERAWLDGKEVAVPKCGDNNSMEFYRIGSFEEVAPGYCDIPEPIGGDRADDSEALILMPGLAFDMSFNRIGYGGGFYDRYLDRKPGCRFVKVAFAYDFQLLEHIDAEEHDHKVDIIVTAGGCIFSEEFEKNE